MFCPNCGSQIPEGAKFCPKCGGTLRNVGTGNPAPTGVQPADEGKKEKNPRKRGRIIWALVAGIVAFIAVITIVGKKPKETDHQSQNINVDSVADPYAVEPYYDDVLRCIQGDWYIWEKDGTRRHFVFDGEELSEHIQLPPSSPAINYTGTSSYTLDGHIKMDRRGELKLSDETEIIYYKYDEKTDSIILTCDGIVLEREDVYGSIMDLIQGFWVAEEYSEEYYDVKKGINFENTKFGAALSGEWFDGEVEISPDGKLILTSDYHRDEIIYYEYDENAHSITLTFDGNVLERNTNS